MPKKLPSTSQPESFEAAMSELADLVAQMEAGELPLEASVSAYKRGSELIKYCAGQLDQVETQVKILEADMLKPFSADADKDGNRQQDGEVEA
ncbi:MAG: exodeoxyribonuclease VII small subunit [Pseudomonadota bacterium]